MGRRGARGFSVVCAAMLVAVSTGCSSASAALPAPSTAPTARAVAAIVQWPSTMAAIGHSGLRGYNADGSRADVVDDSWATGTNPLVDSVYRRIVAENPAMAGGAVNIAVSGSDVDGLLAQAQAIVDVEPAPELVIVQSIDNDIRCDGTDAEHLPVYREKLTEVMATLRAGLPGATVFVVTPWASVKQWADTVFALDPGHLTGTGLCNVVDPSIGDEDPARIAVVQHLVDEYTAVVTEVCAEYSQCFTDGGAMRDADLAPDELTSDRQHLSVPGQARMAEVEFEVLREHLAR